MILTDKASVFTGLGPSSIARKAHWRLAPTKFAKAFRDLTLCCDSELMLGGSATGSKQVFLEKIQGWMSSGKHDKARWWLNEAVKRTIFTAPQVSYELAAHLSKLDGQDYDKKLALMYKEANFINQARARFYIFTKKMEKSDLRHVPTLEDHLASSGTDPELGRLLLTIANLSINMREEFPAFLFKENQVNNNQTNKYKEVVHAMDAFANEALRDIALGTGLVGFVHSEEEHGVVSGPSGRRYRIAFDPLDGSSNIQSFNAFGTIFSVYPVYDEKASLGPNNQPILLDPSKLTGPDGQPVPLDPAKLTGRDLLMAGMVIYGSVHGLIYSMGKGVQRFVRHRKGGRLCFLLENADMRIPNEAKVYGVGGFRHDWPNDFHQFIQHLESGLKAKVRYCGGFVPDFYQVLSHGGLFAYPSTTSAPNGKLRVAYECIPGAFLVEQAGGLSYDMRAGSLLDVSLGDFDGRSPIVVGTASAVKDFMSHHGVPFATRDALAGGSA